MKMEHSPGELEVCAVEGGWDGVRIKDGPVICELVLNHPANANHLALCWNSHDALLTACKELIRFCESKERLNGDSVCPVKAYDLAKRAITDARKG